MPKQKTHKGIAKRMKVTGTGKVKRKRSFGSHLMSTKNAKRRRRITSTTMVKGKVAKTYADLID
ncbi:MAG TPA: 50S ribosomal protein L35 [Anaerohalosphaeraceae bacterium]|jgi:large subunit ribosomal protein L35|nr:50S ribosomal protein L35 [Anaerohalosphaeraceae bacterium]HRT50322.1 50S ribosomal protein L35 [Anaerohalosphaeraceae bacterium]HRT86252.1 50S ribosomal protein L35 [Anaerohalosphaeraceae bacterium]